MEKKNYKKRKIATLAIALVFIIAISCAVVSVGDFEFDNSDSVTQPLSVGIVTNSGQMSSFTNGSSYVFTDSAKFRNYRDGLEEYDISVVEVDTSSANQLGSKLNPYVINSIDDWNAFAKAVDADSNHGKDKYYVMTSDLTYTTSDTFYPIVEFRGSFCGQGHSFTGHRNLTLDYHCLSFKF